MQVFDDPALLFSGSEGLSVGTQAQLAQLQQQFGFQFVGTFLQNVEGFGEKWFKDRLGNWFALTPAGNLVRWDGKSFASSAQNRVATVDPMIFSDPALLFNASVIVSANALNSLAQLENQFGFQFVGTFYQNVEGFGEKWFKDQGGNWFALTADGSLVQWDGISFASSKKHPVAVLDPAVFDNPDLLFDV